MVTKDGARWSVTIPGRPSGKKNRMAIVQVRGRPLIVQNPQVKAYCRGAAKWVASHWRRPPLAGPVTLSCRVYQHPRQRGDLSNYLSALCDILQDAQVVGNDRQISRIGDCELGTDREAPRMEVTLTWELDS